MTQIKPDNIQFSTLTQGLINYDTRSTSIVISGSIADGNTVNFSGVLSVARTNSIADIYATNRNTGKKMSLVAGSIHHPYQSVSSETHAHSIQFIGTSMTVTLSIDNFTGGPITLTSQTWDIVVVLYDVPY